MAETCSLKLTEAVVQEAAESLGLRINKLYRRLTFEEIDQRRWKGLCIFCDELETPDHHLRHKNSGILMLDCDDDQPPNGKELVETEVDTESSETEQRTVNHESTADMNLALLEEESLPQFQVSVSNSEILSNMKLSEENSVLENLVVMNDNLEQKWDQNNVLKRFEVDGVVERIQQVTIMAKNSPAHQLFGIKSQYKERLGIKKKRKRFKSRMFKYKRGLRKLQVLTFFKNMRMVFSQQMGMVETSSDLLMWNGKDSPPKTAIGSELEAVETDSSSQERRELCTENKEEVKGCFKRIQASVLMKEKPDSVKVNEVTIETDVVDSDMSLSIIVLETGREEGGWELDETIEEAASRESLEEAGVVGNVEKQLGKWDFLSKSRGTVYEGLMFPLLVKEELELWPEQHLRRRIWMKVDEAREACRDWWMKEALDVLVQRLSSPSLKPMVEDKTIPLISIC